MDSLRYIGLDLHRDTISAAVLDNDGTLMVQSVLATRAAAVTDFLSGIKGTQHVTFEECCHSAWLYDLLNSRVAKLVVCNPRKNALLKFGSKSDAIDARKLAELLRAGMLAPVYHGENSVLEIHHLARCYGMLTDDTTRIKSRLKAVFRSQAIACTGKRLYGNKHRDNYLKELGDGGQRRRADYLYQELDALQKLRCQARHELMTACRKHPAAKWLQSVPFLGPLRTAILLGRVKTPFRFRTKRQLWAYCGLAIETRDSGEYHLIEGQIERKKKPGLVRGLNQNHNHDLKDLFKGAATTASARDGIFREFYLGLLQKGMQPEMARLTLARKIAAITLKIWKKGEMFNPKYLMPQAA
jgi:transposase